MRRTPVLAAVAVSAALVLAGCGSSKSPSAGGSPSATPPAGSPSASASASPTTPPPIGTNTGGVTVKGAYGAKPTLTFPAGHAAPAGLQREVIKQGTGPTVQKGDLLAANYLGQIWGGKVFDSSWDHGQILAFTIGVGQVIPGWDETMVGMKTGSRVVVTIPPQYGYGSQGNPSAGIKGTDTIVFVVDIVGTYGPNAAADPKATPQKLPSGLPTVSGDLGKEAKVTVPKGTPEPKSMQAYVVAKGTGPAVTDGTAIVQYAATDWAGAQSGSTWTNGGPQGITIDSKTKTTDNPFSVLAGLPVGSRVLIVVPPTAASAAGATPSTAAQPALAAVVDIIAQPKA